MSEHFSIQREEELFDAASRLDNPVAQCAYLAAACSDDTAMRQRMEELLALRPAADKFFVRPADSMTPLRSIGTPMERTQES